MSPSNTEPAKLADMLRVAMTTWDELPPQETDSPTPPPGPTSDSGRQIGRYRLMDMLGEGGFGIVWRAVQTTPIQRQVALKIIKAGMDTEQVVARFNSERQTLALMDHPGIASVYDAGSTDTGRPFFVMELVEGSPITTYCDDHKLDIAGRLRLFVEVCRAVQHAHQKGILHRDLKPSNILVVEIDGKPLPKIIDFGICKALDTLSIAADSFQTQGDLVLGTPNYMSPEQALLGNPDLDTRTDIYSLGVILFELLTGQTPLPTVKGPPLSLGKLLDTVRQHEPARPSTVARLASEHQATDRALPSAEWPRRLRGDLDWITLKALAKNREARYESADALAADILCHLADLPVAAGRPSLPQLAIKFARRNRTLVATASTVVLGLVAGALLLTYALIRESRMRKIADTLRDHAERQTVAAQQERLRAEKHEAEAERQRDLAISNSQKAHQTLDFLTKLLERTGDFVSRGKNPEALRLALDDMTSDRGRFGADPAIREVVTGRMASIYRALQDNDKALLLYEQHLELLKNSRPSDDPEFLTAREHYARALFLEGKVLESCQEYDGLVDYWKSRLHTRDGARRLFFVRRNRADVWVSTGRLKEALAELDDIRATATPEIRSHSSWPVLLRNHAEALTKAGRWQEAEKTYNEALHGLDLSNPDHQQTASAIHQTRAALFTNTKEAQAAITALELAIHLQMQAKGRDSPWLSPWWIQVSRLYSAQHRHHDAIAACQAALAVVDRTGQTDRFQIVHRALANNYEAADNHEQAAAYYRNASKFALRESPPPPIAWVDLSRSMIHLTLCGRHAEAAALAQSLEPVLASWRHDPDRGFEVDQVETALTFTQLAAAEATQLAIPPHSRDLGQRLGAPIIAAFVKRADRDEPTPFVKARDVLNAPDTAPRSSLTSSDFLAFDQAIHDRWAAGDQAASLFELAAALRLCGRHRDAVSIYQIASTVTQKNIIASGRHHTAKLLAAETLDQLGERDAASQLLAELRENHSTRKDPIANPRVLQHLGLTILSPTPAVTPVPPQTLSPPPPPPAGDAAPKAAS